MKWLILGALLGVLIAVPQALDLGAVARPFLPLPRRWAR